METPRSASRSRRSYPNLHNLSLAPLSAKYTPHSSPPSPHDEPRTPATSYIAQKSAPSTPGILNLGHDRGSLRHGGKKAYAYDGYLISLDQASREVGDIPKAKSTNTLNPGVSFAEEPRHEKRHHVRKHTAPLPLTAPLTKHHTKEANEEWFHRAGIAIVEQTRDRKGQGWLVRRASSTSVLEEPSEPDERHVHPARPMTLLSGEHADAGFPVCYSPRHSRAGSRIVSRIHSRAPSARQSRRGSRVGSRVDLTITAGTTSQSVRHSPDMSDLEQRLIEPDFVEREAESDGDEEEIARLSRERGFGLGSWMDRLIGWTLFDVDEDGESSEEEEDDEPSEGLRLANFSQEELRLRREVEAKRRKLERESIIASSALGAREERSGRLGNDASRPTTSDGSRSLHHGDEVGGGWQDAAWLLSVASKALMSG